MPADLIAPNVHVALIHFPLALLAVGVAVEVFAFVWPRSTLGSAGRWMVLLGALSAVPTAFSGIYALKHIARVPVQPERPWVDFKAASPVLSDPAIWHALWLHTVVQAIATGLAVLSAVVFLGSSDRARHVLRVPVLAVLVLAVGGMMVGAWFSGAAIYDHGAGVDRGWPPTAKEKQPPALALFPPAEYHLIFAGTAIAIALASVGLSFRKLAVLTDPAGVDDPDHDHGSTDLARSFNPNLELIEPPAAVPAGRFWLLAFVVAASTSALGWLLIALGADVLSSAHGRYGKIPALLWDQVKPLPGQTVNRLLAHLATGGVIILVPLVLAALARWAPRQRAVLATLTLVLTLAIAAQVWFGVLLMYDGSDGPINHFNPPADATAAAN